MTKLERKQVRKAKSLERNQARKDKHDGRTVAERGYDEAVLSGIASANAGSNIASIVRGALCM